MPKKFTFEQENLLRGEKMNKKTKNKKNQPISKIPMKLLVVTTIAVFAIIVVIVLLQNNQNKDSGDITLNENLPIKNQPTLGNPDSSVSVVEFADYKCPACKEWIEYIYPQLKKDYIDTGKISFTYINVLFHEEESILGALAGEAVWNQDSDAFWDFSKALYIEQPERAAHDAKWLTLEKVMEVAKNTVPHIDLDQLKQDILDQKYEEAIRQDEELVEKAEVKLTPSIVINGIMVEDPYDNNYIKKLIERGLEQ